MVAIPEKGLAKKVVEQEALVLEIRGRRNAAATLKEMAELSRAFEEETQVLAQLRHVGRRSDK